MKELGEILAAMLKQKDRVPDQRELLLDMSDLIVKAVSQAFTCKPDEVAILLLTADGRHLRFIAPRPFAELGTIPLTKRDAIAVRVLSGRRGEVINNVPMVKHVTFFESVKLREKPAPIQKMVTTPILVRQHADRCRGDQPQGHVLGHGGAGLHARRTCGGRPRSSS